MKLKLEALSPAEGIGIVRKGQTLRLIRPPYVSHDAPVLTEESLQNAILRHGFAASQKQFVSWEDVIAFLNEQVVAVRQLLGKEIPDSIPDTDIVDVAPPEVLSNFLDRVETDLIPQRRFDHAENFLLALWASSAHTRYPEVGSRAAKLLQRNKDARKQAEARISELVNCDACFPSLEEHGELERSARLATRIKERRSVFSLAA